MAGALGRQTIDILTGSCPFTGSTVFLVCVFNCRVAGAGVLSTPLLQAMEASLKTAVPIMVMLIAFILLQSTG